MLSFKRIEHPNSLEWTIFIHGAGGSSAVWHKQVKDFTEHFNVLLIDLRGHGKSKNLKFKGNYSFELVTKDVVEVVQHNKIQQAHYIGVSLGSIIINQIQLEHPELVKTVVFSGAITKLNIKSRLLLRIGRILNPIMHYMALYKFFASVMMPKESHKQSRNLFINEAQKLMNNEFKRWFKLTARLTKHLKYLQSHDNTTKGLYMMGGEDHLFLEPARDFVSKNPHLTLEIVPNCGHVVNYEKFEVFNKVAIQFIHDHS